MFGPCWYIGFCGQSCFWLRSCVPAKKQSSFETDAIDAEGSGAPVWCLSFGRKNTTEAAAAAAAVLAVVMVVVVAVVVRLLIRVCWYLEV